MIKKAFVSGQIARSIFEKDDRLFILNAGDPQNIIECTPDEKNLFFNSGGEINVFENISLDDLRETLLNEKNSFDALSAVISGFDRNLSEESRLIAIQQADQLVRHRRIFEFVRNRLFGKPVPKEADLKIAGRLAKQNDCSYIYYFYHILGEKKDIIKLMVALFDKRIGEMGLVNDREKITSLFVSKGIFAKLFIFTSNKSIPGLNDFVSHVKNNKELREGIPKISELLDRMKSKLVRECKSRGSKGSKPEEIFQPPVEDDFRKERSPV
ncbi:MAG: hypothetical protein GY940_30880 [bacterium]|nr:hypothetical protein [bacterium]